MKNGATLKLILSDKLMRLSYKFLIIYLLFIPKSGVSQSGILDPYRLDYVNYSGSFPQTGAYPQYINQAFELVCHSVLDDANPYNGEYVIHLREHPFAQNGVGFVPFTDNFELSYKMEIVSFPFTINCWNVVGTGCANNTLVRKFEMPVDQYNNSLNGWGTGTDPKNYIYNVRTDGEFLGNSGSGFYSGGDTHPEALVSTAFIHDEFVPGTDWRYTFPHTVIKHTVYFHCNNSPYTPFDSIQWTSDNTRGRMKWYPFKSDNIADNGPIYYDLLLKPEIISKPDASFYYAEGSNSSWMDGGTIDYSNFNANLSQTINCPASLNEGYFPSSPSLDLFRLYNNGTYELQYGDTPPYSLMNSFVRNANGTLLAGYLNQNNQMEIPNFYKGIEHEYFIDKGYPDLDLTLINSNTKEIYNPSEVFIDPDAGVINGTNPPIEVIFPEDYTFKTILGRYPSSMQVSIASLDPQNGTYSDLTKVPVPVNAADLHSIIYDPLDYPQVMWDDPLTGPHVFYDDERFGYYYIKDKATLTISSCVKLFDARFAVNSGGTMRFNDYSQILGYEDTDANLGRYKIRGEGGAILRNYALFQHLQNGVIFQLIPLNYIATSYIIAGENVDPDTDQPTGIYEIKAGADVTFTSGNYIHLKDGFYVSGGDFHAVIDENLPVPMICYDNSGQNGGNRLQQQADSPQSSNANFISIAPSPNQGFFTIKINGVNFISAVSLFDLTGCLVFHKNDLHEKSYGIQLASDIKGLFIAKIVDDKG